MTNINGIKVYEVGDRVEVPNNVSNTPLLIYLETLKDKVLVVTASWLVGELYLYNCKFEDGDMLVMSQYGIKAPVAFTTANLELCVDKDKYFTVGDMVKICGDKLPRERRNILSSLINSPSHITSATLSINGECMYIVSQTAIPSFPVFAMHDEELLTLIKKNSNGHHAVGDLVRLNNSNSTVGRTDMYIDHVFMDGDVCKYTCRYLDSGKPVCCPVTKSVSEFTTNVLSPVREQDKKVENRKRLKLNDRVVVSLQSIPRTVEGNDHFGLIGKSLTIKAIWIDDNEIMYGCAFEETGTAVGPNFKANDLILIGESNTHSALDSIYKFTNLYAGSANVVMVVRDDGMMSVRENKSCDVNKNYIVTDHHQPKDNTLTNEDATEISRLVLSQLLADSTGTAPYTPLNSMNEHETSTTVIELAKKIYGDIIPRQCCNTSVGKNNPTEDLLEQLKLKCKHINTTSESDDDYVYVVDMEKAMNMLCSICDDAAEKNNDIDGDSFKKGVLRFITELESKSSANETPLPSESKEESTTPKSTVDEEVTIRKMNLDDYMCIEDTYYLKMSILETEVFNLIDALIEKKAVILTSKTPTRIKSVGINAYDSNLTYIDLGSNGVDTVAYREFIRNALFGEAILKELSEYGLPVTRVDNNINIDNVTFDLNKIYHDITDEMIDSRIKCSEKIGRLYLASRY